LPVSDVRRADTRAASNLGKLDNQRQEPWKLPLPEFIEDLYFKRFGKHRPDVVVSIEGKIEEKVRREEDKRARSGLAEE
jgi:hypothetical protein